VLDSLSARHLLLSDAKIVQDLGVLGQR